MSENLPQPDGDCRDGKQRRQAKAAAALAMSLGKTVEQAAKAAGVSVRTIYRWNTQAKFRTRVHELRGAAIGAAVNRLSHEMTSAADVLAKLLKSRNEGTRLKAARGILELSTKLRESEELEARVTELERQFAGGHKS